MLVGSIALASGNVEDKFRLSLSIWPRNCWVETGAAFVLACFAYDSSIAFRTVRLRKVKLTDWHAASAGSGRRGHCKRIQCTHC